MRKVPIFSWVLVAFFFFGGAAFVYFEETRSIGIGQIWMAVAVFLAVVFLLVGGGLKGKFDLGGKFSKGGSSGSREQLERLERLHESGDLTDAEYQSQRDRIISQS